MRMINAAEVRRLLPMAACIDLMRQAFRQAAEEGATVQPIRTGVLPPGGAGALGLMPGWMAEPQALGIKLVTIFPGNHGGPLGSHQGAILIFDPSNGRPLACIEARSVTAIRTAAASAAATDALARKDARTLAMFGLGDQATAHLEALPHVRQFDEIVVWGRDADKARAFAANCGAPVRAEADLETAARAADVLCLVTAAAQPFLEGVWLKPGAHVNAVGASVPTAAEVDVEAVARSRYFADYVPSARALAGEFKQALEAGAVGEAHMLGAVGDVLTGRIPARAGESDITLFKSLGMAAEDLIAAHFLLAEAQAKRVGVEVEW